MTRFRCLLKRRWPVVAVLAGAALLSAVAFAFGFVPAIPADGAHNGTDRESSHVARAAAVSGASDDAVLKPAAATATTDVAAKPSAANVPVTRSSSKAPVVKPVAGTAGTTGVDDDKDGDFDDCGDAAGIDDDASEADDDADEVDEDVPEADDDEDASTGVDDDADGDYDD
jgi:hypothetical protein